MLHMRTRDNKLRELISVTHHNFLKSNLNFESRFEVVRMLKFLLKIVTAHYRNKL